MIDDGIIPDQFTKQKMDQYVAQSASDVGKVQTFETFQKLLQEKQAAANKPAEP